MGHGRSAGLFERMRRGGDLALAAATARALSENRAQPQRVRRERWGPRVIDIDILLFGDVSINEDGLQIPHPQMTKRAFVLVPLAALAADIQIAGTPIDALLNKLPEGDIRQITPDGSWWQETGSIPVRLQCPAVFFGLPARQGHAMACDHALADRCCSLSVAATGAYR